MIFHIFLYHPSLQNNGEDNSTMVDRLMVCRDVVVYIDRFPQAHDIQYWKEEFLSTTLFKDGTTIEELIYNPKQIGFQGKEVTQLILKIIKDVKASDIHFESLKRDLATRESKQECDIGLVVCKMTTPFQKVVTSCDDIVNLHLDIITAGRITSEKLRSEGKYVFENLIFSKLNDAEFKEVVRTHPKKIIGALKLLNACFSVEYHKLRVSKSHDEALEEFGITHKEIDGCSSEAYESSFDIEFELEDGSKVVKRCTPHLKLDSNDLNQSKHYARIYFAIPDSPDSSIYIGRIIKHAETKKSKGKKRK